jgi:hypothetical protein
MIMIEIKTTVTDKPKKLSNGMTIIGSKKAVVRADRVKNDKGIYAARLTHPEEDAPNNIELWHPHPVWVYFRKSENKSIKIPVLQVGHILEL